MSNLTVTPGPAPAVPNLVTAAIGQADTGGKLTAEAARQADERSAAAGMVKRMRLADDKAAAELAARYRRAAGTYVVTIQDLDRRIEQAAWTASRYGRRRGFTLDSGRTPELWADLIGDLGAYACRNLADALTCATCAGPAAWQVLGMDDYGTSFPTNAYRCHRHRGDLARRASVNPDALPLDKAVAGNLLRDRAIGWLTDHMRSDVADDSASIDGDAAIADALTDTGGEWRPSADADRLTDALDGLTQAERIAVDAALTGGTLKEQAAALGRTVGYVKSARSKGAARLADRLMSGDLRATLEDAGMAELTAAERAELEGAALRSTLRNSVSTTAGTKGGSLAPRALSAGSILTGAAAAEVLADDASGALPLPGLTAAGRSNAGHAIDRTEPAAPYRRADLIPPALGHAARRDRAARNAARLRLTAPGLGPCKVPDAAAAATAERKTRERTAQRYIAAAARWAARADRIEDHGTYAAPIERGNAERYRATADRITSGEWGIGRVSMLRAPIMPRS